MLTDFRFFHVELYFEEKRCLGGLCVTFLKGKNEWPLHLRRFFFLIFCFQMQTEKMQVSIFHPKKHTLTSLKS